MSLSLFYFLEFLGHSVVLIFTYFSFCQFNQILLYGLAFVISVNDLINICAIGNFQPIFMWNWLYQYSLEHVQKYILYFYFLIDILSNFKEQTAVSLFSSSSRVPEEFQVNMIKLIQAIVNVYTIVVDICIVAPSIIWIGLVVSTIAAIIVTTTVWTSINPQLGQKTSSPQIPAFVSCYPRHAVACAWWRQIILIIINFCLLLVKKRTKPRKI